jgi:hypothetical protein
MIEKSGKQHSDHRTLAALAIVRLGGQEAHKELGSGAVWRIKALIPNESSSTAVQRARAFISARVGRRDLAFSITLKTIVVKPQGLSGLLAR